MDSFVQQHRQEASAFRGLLFIKRAQDFAPGIMDKNVYGDVLGTLKPGDITDFVLQHHSTVRNPKYPHYDLRLGTKDTNLFSWAVPKADLPPPGEMRRPIPQTQLHTYQYGSFEGKIPHGYGAGTVTMADKGKAIITRVTPNTLHFTLGHTRVPTRYVLVHTKGRDGKMWQIMAQPTPGTIPGVGDKPVYKQISAVDQDDAIAQAAQLQEKIDGAHGILNIGDKGEADMYSVNPSVTGKPISHTERMGMFGVRVPIKYRKSAFRGEMYFKDESGKAVPFKETSGLLNMLPAKSIESQRARGLIPQVALFDAIQHQGKRLDGTPLSERQQIVRELLRELPEEIFHEPETATTPEEKQKLVDDVRTGKNPRTSEGVMAVMPDDKIMKIKNKLEATGYLTGTYPGTGKRKGTAGGLTFVTDRDKKGGPQGKVGTGFTDQELADIVANLQEHLGKPIRIEHMGQFGSGKLRAPSFKGFETDKTAAVKTAAPIPSKVLQAIISKNYDALREYARRGGVVSAARKAQARARAAALNPGPVQLNLWPDGVHPAPSIKRAAPVQYLTNIFRNSLAGTLLKMRKLGPVGRASARVGNKNKLGMGLGWIAGHAPAAAGFAINPALGAALTPVPFSFLTMPAGAMIQQGIRNMSKAPASVLAAKSKQYIQPLIKPGSAEKQAVEIGTVPEDPAINTINRTYKGQPGRLFDRAYFGSNKDGTRPQFTAMPATDLKKFEQASLNRLGGINYVDPRGVSANTPAYAASGAGALGGLQIAHETPRFVAYHEYAHGTEPWNRGWPRPDTELPAMVTENVTAMREGYKPANPTWADRQVELYGPQLGLPAQSQRAMQNTPGYTYQRGTNTQPMDMDALQAARRGGRVDVGTDTRAIGNWMNDLRNPETNLGKAYQNWYPRARPNPQTPTSIARTPLPFVKPGHVKSAAVPPPAFMEEILARLTKLQPLSLSSLRLNNPRGEAAINSFMGVTHKIVKEQGKQFRGVNDPLRGPLGKIIGLMSENDRLSRISRMLVNNDFNTVMIDGRSTRAPGVMFFHGSRLDPRRFVYAQQHIPADAIHKPILDKLPRIDQVGDFPVRRPLPNELTNQLTQHADTISSRALGGMPLKSENITDMMSLSGLVGFANKSSAARAVPTKVNLKFVANDGTAKAAALVEVADTPELRRRGLSNRKTLDENSGMFFDKAGVYWMKDVEFPLDLVFVDKEGTVLEKRSMPVEIFGYRPSWLAETLYAPSSPKAAHAIELPAGWCDKHQIKAGDRVSATGVNKC